jgi:hypothetical protein
MMAWIGTAASIAGAFMVAFGFTVLGYSSFLIGAGAWLLVAFRQRDKALGVLNATFFCANIIGLVRNLT